MTISNSINRKEYAGDGATTSFATSPVVFFNSSELVCYVVTNATGGSTTLTENTHYSVSGGGSSTAAAVGTVDLSGGSTPNGAPASGETLIIERNVAITQTTDLVNNDINDADVEEAALDKLTLIAQQLNSDVGRAIKQPVVDVTAIDELPVAVSRASKVLGFDAAGQITTYDASSAVTTSDNVTFVQSGSGAVATTVQDELRNWVTPLQFGAVGDGSNDDTAALALWLAAGATRNLYLPAGTWTTTVELAYNTATSGPLKIAGAGANAVLKATGTSNKVLHITGTAGVTRALLELHSFAITSNTSGTSSVGLHLDGIANWSVRDVWIDGNSKMTDGIRCTAAQQGEVSGGRIHNCTVGAVLEDNSGGGITSSGIDWHGMSFVNTTTNFKVALNGAGFPGAGTLDFHGNHLTSAAMQIDIEGGGAGVLTFTANHLEPLAGNDGAIVREGRTVWVGNTIIAFTGTDGLNISGGANTYENKIIGNIISGNITISSGSENNVFSYNSHSGTFTDNGTNTEIWGNHSYTGAQLVSKAKASINPTGAVYLGSPTAATNFFGLNRTVSGAVLNSGIAAFNLYNDGTNLNIERYTGAGTASGSLQLKTGGALDLLTGATSNFAVTSSGVGTMREGFTACKLIGITAGGSASMGLMLSSTANFGVFFGSGAPSLAAAKGSLYLRSDGSGTSDRMYVNTDGSTTWTAVTTAA